MQKNSENSEISLRACDGAPNVLEGAPPISLDEQMWRLNLYLTVKKDAERRLLSSLVSVKVKEDVLAGVYDVPGFSYSEVLRKKISKPEVYFLVTISLPDIPSNQIKESVGRFNKILDSRKFIPSGSIWVYEQRGSSDSTYLTGMHIHIAMPKGKKYKNEIIRDLSVPFKIESSYVNVVERPKEAALKYLTEEKTGVGKDGEAKNLKQPYDVRMRKEYGIENYYSRK